MKNKIVVLKKKQTKMIEALSILLADTYTLYLKTQNYHWNVTGPHFSTLHLLFESQYKELADANDVIAERIRALKAKAPGTFHEFLKMTSLHEGNHQLSAEKMIHDLQTDHESISKSIVKAFEIAKEMEDEVSLDLLIQRKNEHDKTAWMLRSLQA